MLRGSLQSGVAANFKVRLRTIARQPAAQPRSFLEMANVFTLSFLLALVSPRGTEGIDACTMKVSEHMGVRGSAYRRLPQVTTPEECCAMCMHDGDSCAAWELQSKNKGLDERLCAK